MNSNKLLNEYIRSVLINERFSIEIQEEYLNEGLKDFVKRKAQIAAFLLPAISAQIGSNVKTADASPANQTAVTSTADNNSILSQHAYEELDNLLNFITNKHEGSQVKNGVLRYFKLEARKRGYSLAQIKAFLETMLDDMVVTGKRPEHGETGEYKISNKVNFQGAEDAVQKIIDVLESDRYEGIRNQLSTKFMNYFNNYKSLFVDSDLTDEKYLSIYKLLKLSVNMFKKRSIEADQLYCFILLLSGDNVDYEILMRGNLSGLQTAGTSNLKKSDMRKIIGFFYNDIENLTKEQKINETKSMLKSASQLTAILNILSFRKALTQNKNSGKFLKLVSKLLKPITRSDHMDSQRDYTAR